MHRTRLLSCTACPLPSNLAKRSDYLDEPEVVSIDLIILRTTPSLRWSIGKSTLAMSLLRFVDPTEGKIVIDGVDIQTIGLHDLRSRIVCRLSILWRH